MKATVTVLRKRARTHANIRRLDELSARLEFVGESTEPLREPVRLDRSNTAFHELHKSARTFLQGDWQATNQGDSSGFALLFPMNDLFEKFIARKMLGTAGGRSVETQPSRKFALQEGAKGRFQLKPDLIFDGDIVIDTKWKSSSPTSATLASPKAMYTKCSPTQAHTTPSVSCSSIRGTQGSAKQQRAYSRWTVSGKPTPFHIATVDIGDPPGVADALRRIIES